MTVNLTSVIGQSLANLFFLLQILHVSTHNFDFYDLCLQFTQESDSTPGETFQLAISVLPTFSLTYASSAILRDPWFWDDTDRLGAIIEPGRRSPILFIFATIRSWGKMCEEGSAAYVVVLAVEGPDVTDNPETYLTQPVATLSIKTNCIASVIRENRPLFHHFNLSHTVDDGGFRVNGSCGSSLENSPFPAVLVSLSDTQRKKRDV
ncbi:hypothetical protein DL96DRAFT_1721433 [Flagelloscypha sp. PMI_526]|nr:hypothetical protein DL96DRAFT_1721433 [Flagelloscypha sp. PMI_526]